VTDDSSSHGSGATGPAPADRPGLAGEDRSRQAGSRSHQSGPGGQVAGIPDELVTAAGEGIVHPAQSPLYHAQNAQRYERQSLISTYERTYNCRLVVLIDMLFPYSINLFEDLVYDADPAQDMHLMLSTPGGDGETAVRLVRSAQKRCRELTVIVPDQAKSAGTILALGAHHILLGPTSDLGPIDPQFQIGQGLVSAKDIIAAVGAAEEAIKANPGTYPLHASLLADLTGLIVQQARSALARSEDIMREALASQPDRSEEDVEELCQKLKQPLIDDPKSHSAILSAPDAIRYGLPVTEADPWSDQWQLLWRLWIKYWSLGNRAYESVKASELIPWSSPNNS
jgi:hypothetical protein